VRVGFAAIDITPPVGVELTGFIAREGPSTGVHDPLLAMALVFEDAGARAALVAVDLIGLGRNLVRRVRARVMADVGIPGSAQMLSCTHTHGGPETGALTTIALPDIPYLRRLEETLVDVIAAANSSLRPARLGVAQGR
jgi:neutral ceramidase